MKKDFDAWNIQKKKAHNSCKRPMFKECEVWWCSLGANVGDEQDGKWISFARPVLILRKSNHKVFVGVPFSTQLKDGPFYYQIYFNGISQSVLLSQIRLMDAKRFGARMGKISPEEAINRLPSFC